MDFRSVPCPLALTFVPVRPVCVAGARNCPPEDVGGVWGYQNFCKIMSDPKHEEYESMLEWHEKKYDPEHFSMEEVNGRLTNPDKYYVSFE